MYGKTVFRSLSSAAAAAAKDLGLVVSRADTAKPDAWNAQPAKTASHSTVIPDGGRAVVGHHGLLARCVSRQYPGRVCSAFGD